MTDCQPVKRALVPACIAARARKGDRDDTGAALILALVFVVVAALSVGGLVTFAGNSLLDTAQLKVQRGIQYGADGATQIAIQAVRYRPDFFATGPENCLGSPVVSVKEGTTTHSFAVYCKGTAAPVLTLKGPTTGAKITVSGGTASVSTAALFAAGRTFVGYAIADQKGGIPATPVATIVSETNASHSAVISSAGATVTAEPKDTIVLVSVYQRFITFYTCKTSCTKTKLDNMMAGRTQTATTRTPNLEVVATVDFRDRTSLNGGACTTSASATCGTAVLVRQWVVKAAND